MMIHRVALGLLLAAVIGAALASCGKRGDPVLPNGESDNYPATYPQSNAPQTGVFSD
jgi:predicted small lipoprotein YifL